jgi:hypothetical protein
MQYPHWLMVGGAVLVVLGFVGFAFRQKRDVELDHEQTEMKANGNETGETQTLPPFPLGHGARHLKRAKPSGPPVTAWDAAQSIFELRRTPGLARSLRLRLDAGGSGDQ